MTSQPTTLHQRRYPRLTGACATCPVNASQTTLAATMSAKRRKRQTSSRRDRTRATPAANQGKISG